MKTETLKSCLESENKHFNLHDYIENESRFLILFLVVEL